MPEVAKQMAVKKLWQHNELLGHDSEDLNKMQLQKLSAKSVSPRKPGLEDWRLKVKALKHKKKLRRPKDRQKEQDGFR